jgi:hypothetical protein
MLTFETERDGARVSYTSEPLPVGKQIDMGLEIMEMIGPVLGVLAAAQQQDMSAELLNAISQDTGQAFGKVARALMKAGGSAYIMKLCEACHVTRQPQGSQGVKITAQNFNLILSGKGGGAELVRVTRWLIMENFMDFFTDLLVSPGQADQAAD